MCGIAGYYNSHNSTTKDPRLLTDMIGVLRHRGPDDTGYFHGDGVALGQSRLSIIDIAGGKQPIHNEDQTVWVVFNGEIFNYIELRDELIKKGHRFYTQSDTEAIVHAYEEFGYDFFNHLNGQFAIAIWDDRQKKLVIGRDRVGIRPLFYSHLDDGTFLFGSEIKAIFKFPGFKRELDPAGIDQIFTYWVNVPPRTVFKNICELPPAHFLVVDRDGLKTNRFWSLTFPGATEYSDHPRGYYEKQLQELIYDATTLRLRADVPVASYLSGGIDSSIISALVKKSTNSSSI